MTYRFLLLLFLLSTVQSGGVQARQYQLGTEPGWVSHPPLPDRAWVTKADHADGVAYLLIDRQFLVAEGGQQTFAHFAEQAVNTSGVGEISNLSIQFDPLYEKLTLHKLLIHRDGRVIDCLDRARIDLLQRETGLDSQIYDGEKTLNILIEDVRVGDIVEHSYTLDGGNPAFAGHFAQSLATQWSVPVGRVHYSLLWPRDKMLYFKTANRELKPQIASEGHATRYTWLQDGVDGLVLGDSSGAPEWYQPFGRLYLSDYVSWSEVSRWGWPLYRQQAADGLVREAAAAVAGEVDSEEGRILAVLRFVQDEIRYLGMEMGVHSYKPASAEQVLSQRFGDCKGKAVLMVEMLKALGIEAQPALVHSSKGKNLAKLLPTPKAFNHVIVYLESGNRRYWLDPTLSYQRGDLSTITQPDYGYAVRITEKGAVLEKMFEHGPQLHSKQVTEYLDLTTGKKGKAAYTIHTRYAGRFADTVRRHLSEASRRETELSYLDYTAQYYPGAEQAKALEVIDDEKSNSLMEVERYLIPEIWQQDENYQYAMFEPFLLYNYIDSDIGPRRLAPLGLAHPVLISQTTRVKLPEGFRFEQEHKEIADKAFRFSYDVRAERGELVLEYRYQSLQDHVLPEDLREYAAHMDQAFEKLGYWIKRPKGNLFSFDFTLDAAGLNSGLLALVYGSMLLVSGLMWWLIFYHDPALKNQIHPDHPVPGLRGWLILPGAALALCPVLVVWLNRELGFLLLAANWAAIGERFGSSMQMVVAGEAVMAVFLALFPLGLLVLYFGRRHTFPGLVIVYLLGWMAYAITDVLAIWLYDLTDPEAVQIGILQFTIVTITVLGIGAYLKLSGRVRTTFTERLAAVAKDDGSSQVACPGSSDSREREKETLLN